MAAIERLFIRDDWFAHAHAAFAIQQLSGKGRLGLHDFKQAAKHYVAALSQFFAEQAIEGPFAITLSIQGLAQGKHSGVGFRISASGGGRGLGRAMVLGLAAQGARVIATAARERNEVEAVAREAALGGVLPMIADVTREEDCARVVAVATERFGRLDILVNNAGRGMKYVSDRFLTEPTRFCDRSGRLAHGN
jgi:hypothetical protein